MRGSFGRRGAILEQILWRNWIAARVWVAEVRIVKGVMRYAVTFFLIVILAGLVAAAFVVGKSSDPEYAARELLSMGRYHKFDRQIAKIGERHGVDPMLIKAVVWRESRFHPHKIGGHGERGLMQITEAAARDWARENRVETFVVTDLFAPETNLEVGTWYLRQALERNTRRDDPVRFALSEYNAGRRRVNEWIATTNRGERATAADLRDAAATSTQGYVESIVERYEFYKRRGYL